MTEAERREYVAIAAYAYEILNFSLISDAEYDAECLKIDVHVDTGDAMLDQWFRENFNPSTGMWIWRHPYYERIGRIAEERVYEAQS